MTAIFTTPDLDPYNATDMATLAREALEEWRKTKGGSAAELRAARMLAWSVGRLIDLGAFPAGRQSDPAAITAC